jgi:hypothetical protein
MSGWTTLEDYPATSIAQIAETTLNGRRLVVRRRRPLHLPARWPWRRAFAEALACIRALAPAT